MSPALSGTRNRIFMRASWPRITSIVMPGRYSFEDLLTGVKQTKSCAVGYDRHTVKHRKDDHGIIRKAEWYDVRTMIPNWDKLTVSNEERQALNNWCKVHQI